MISRNKKKSCNCYKATSENREGCWDDVTSLPKRDKTAFHPDSNIRKGLGKKIQTVFLLNFSFPEGPELNLFNTKFSFRV